MTSGTLTFGSGFNARLIAQSKMNQTALVGRHGAQLHAAMLRLRASSGGVCRRLDFLTLAVLITLDVDDNRVTEAHGARVVMAEMMNSTRRAFCHDDTPIRIAVVDSRSIQNKLALVALVLVDGDFTHVEVLENAL